MNDISGEKNYLVYMHVNKLNNKVYIGITSKLPHQRWGLNGHGYRVGNTAFFGALKKYPDWDNDWDHIVVKQNLTKEDACSAEIELIAQYKSNCCRYKNPSYGYNMTDGGEGRSGSDGLKGEANPNYGKVGKLNPRSRGVYCVEDDVYFESVSLAAKEYHLSSSQVSHRCKNQLTYADIDRHFLYEEDVCPELVARCLLQKRNHRVYCIETAQQFDDAMEAARYVNISVHGIRNSCKKLGQSAAGKHPDTNESLHWLYEMDISESNIQNALKYKERADKHMSRCVYCIETGEYYLKITLAAEKFGIDYTSIWKCCNGKSCSAGVHPITGEELHWLYAEDVDKEHIEQALSTNTPQRHSVAIYCQELNMAFSSIVVPAKALGIAPKSIKKCIDGEIDHAGRRAEDGAFLHWALLNDCQLENEIEIQNECNIEKFFKKIYCIELGRTFTSREAAATLHMDRSHLQACLRGERETAGRHPDTKEPLHWKYIYNESYVGKI